MSEVQQALSSLLPSPVAVLEEQPVSGGCISEAKRVLVRDGRGSRIDYFVKSNRLAFLENFHAEWDGLKRLASTDAIRVPHPIAVGEAGQRAWLILEWIEQQRPSQDFFPRFGRGLADLHRVTLGDRIGLERDNFLGSAPQINSCEKQIDSGGDAPPQVLWPQFFAGRRIEFQLRWATDQGLADAKLRRDVGRIVQEMDRLLAGSESSTSLLHGDLWSGNYLCDTEGAAVLIDPALYYGNREAEFGMLRLFGSCPARFYDAYHDTFPLAVGWQRRVNVYVLYHLLNHLNLFGRGYHNQCCETAAEILRS